MLIQTTFGALSKIGTEQVLQFNSQIIFLNYFIVYLSNETICPKYRIICSYNIAIQLS